MCSSKGCFVAVHAGAGYHSSKRGDYYLKALSEACAAAEAAAQRGADALACVVAAITVLEDNKCTNAGNGSNLTETGIVECDASVMSGDGRFGAVGAAPGIKNPVEAAARLAINSTEPMPLGRVRPLFLAGDGARKWAVAAGIEAAPSLQEGQQMHVCSHTKRAWEKYTAMLEAASAEAAPEVGPGVPMEVAAASRGPSDPAGVPGAGAGESGEALRGLWGGDAATPQHCGFEDTQSAEKIAVRGGESGAADGEIHGGLRSGSKLQQQEQEEKEDSALPLRKRRRAGCVLSQQGRGEASTVTGEQLSERRAGAPPGFQEREQLASPLDDQDDDIQWPPEVADTVGCIFVDSKGNVAAGVSSGGIAMKTEGRVGEAAVFGCGCWAQDAADDRAPGVAVSVTGVGERVMTALLAQQVAGMAREGEGMLHDQCSDAIQSLVLPQLPPWDCGLIALQTKQSGGKVHVEYAAAYSSRSLAVAHYCPATMASPSCRILRQPDSITRGAGASTSSDQRPAVAVYAHAAAWPS